MSARARESSYAAIVDDGAPPKRNRVLRFLPLLLAGLIGIAVPFATPGGSRLCDYVGECGPSVRDVGSGDCVEIERLDAASAKLDEITDCAVMESAVVVAVGTLGEDAASHAQALGPSAFCREAGAIWLAAMPPDIPVDVRMATDGSGKPESGDTYACIVEKADGQDFTNEFDPVRPG